MPTRQDLATKLALQISAMTQADYVSSDAFLMAYGAGHEKTR